MSREKFCLYIMASSTRNLYIGITDDLEETIDEYKAGNVEKPGCDELVYYEPHQFNCNAVRRRDQLKNRMMKKEIAALIEENNPRWEDLSYKI